MKNFQTLLDLQNVDRQLFALEKIKGDLPRSLEELRGRLGELTAAFAEKSSRAAALLQSRHALENGLSLAKERKKKYDSQLFSVKTNTEYDAITLEIENTEKEIDQSETKILEAMEQEGRMKQELEQDEAQLQTLAQEKQQREDALNRLMEQNRSKVEQLLQERQQLTGEVEPGLLRSYDRIRRGKEGGEAVTAITGGACGGCRTRIPSQRAMEIRDMNKIYYCENCGRILIWQEEEVMV